jgi:hypothetical protein
VLPTGELITTLVDSSRQLRSDDAVQNVVFVLDGERSGSIRRPAGDPRIDNRYDLAVGDLPNLQRLQAAGIQRVVKVTRVARTS